MTKEINWPVAIKPLLKKYSGKKHPLEYKNVYQLVVMVVLSAQDSDRHINQVASEFFETFPDMKALSKAGADIISRKIGDVRNFGNKAKWLSEMAEKIKDNKNIPKNLEELIALPGIGRKSANVILRESGLPAEGVIVDLHVARVAPRLGIASGTDPKKIEKQIMDILPRQDWDAGMAISFLGRETCRPTNPKCDACVMNSVCAYYNNGRK
ncbi:MAG: endonuclease III [Bacteroidetes bacterium]|nr:endonuclease III [Bacteroidota bacterium]MBS1973444.1 endonuclease III [Bacteroidota bacterium]